MGGEKSVLLGLLFFHEIFNCGCHWLDFIDGSTSVDMAANIFAIVLSSSSQNRYRQQSGKSACSD